MNCFTRGPNSVTAHFFAKITHKAENGVALMPLDALITPISLSHAQVGRNLHLPFENTAQ
jgi:hypothetical protein